MPPEKLDALNDVTILLPLKAPFVAFAINCAYTVAVGNGTGYVTVNGLVETEGSVPHFKISPQGKGADPTAPTVDVGFAKAVVANCVVDVLIAAVGAVGIPVNDGLFNGAEFPRLMMSHFETPSLTIMIQSYWLARLTDAAPSTLSVPFGESVMEFATASIFLNATVKPAPADVAVGNRALIAPDVQSQRKSFLASPVLSVPATAATTLKSKVLFDGIKLMAVRNSPSISSKSPLSSPPHRSWSVGSLTSGSDRP